MSIRVPLKKLESAGKKAIPSKPSRKASVDFVSDINKKLASFKPAIDVRGKRADEIVSVIQNYIDEAIYLNVKEVSILHGKGDGVLRKIIREYLAKVPEIKSYEDEHVERGGHGITVVNLR
jgi:DNA mismatch repair protein MutS2